MARPSFSLLADARSPWDGADEDEDEDEVEGAGSELGASWRSMGRDSGDEAHKHTYDPRAAEAIKAVANNRPARPSVKLAQTKAMSVAANPIHRRRTASINPPTKANTPSATAALEKDQSLALPNTGPQILPAR